MKTINGKEVTPKNIKDFKPSEYIRSVLDDVQKVKSLGLRINMDSWFSNSEASRKICTVCLGGAAVLAFAEEEKIKSEEIWSHGQLLQLADPERVKHLLDFEEKDYLDNITGLFNSIRQGDWISTSAEIGVIWDINQDLILDFLNPVIRKGSNELWGKENVGWLMKDLEERVEEVAKLLEDKGY